MRTLYRYAFEVAGIVIMWIISGVILAGCYGTGRWAASYLELDINRDTVGLISTLGFFWTGICYFIGHQSDRLYDRLCRLLGRWDAS
jgi:hypothetical protein